MIPSQAGFMHSPKDDKSEENEKKRQYLFGMPALSLPREDFNVVPLYNIKSNLNSTSPSMEKLLDAHPSFGLAGKTEEKRSAIDSKGEIINWDIWEDLWDHAFDKMRVRDSAKNKGNISDGSISHPIMVVEQTGFDLPKGQRETITEIMFEKFNVPAMYIMPSPVLSAFSVGRQNALIIDCGAGGCRATPIIDGMDLKSAHRYNYRGGDWISDQLYEKLVSKGFNVTPRYLNRYEKFNVDSNAGKRQKKSIPITSRSYHLNAIRDLMYEFKSLHCGVYPEKIEKEEDVKVAIKNHLCHGGHEFLREFQLPDGTVVDIMNDHQDLFLLPVSVSLYFIL